MNKPLLPNVIVLALVPDLWSPLWQSRNYILTHLARYFHVVWVNPAHEWRDTLRHWREVVKQQAVTFPFSSEFIVYTPEFWLPELYRPSWLAKLSFHLRLKRALNLPPCQDHRRVILYLWRPEFERTLTSIPFDLSCYHIDDEYSFSDVEVPLDENERRLIARVNQVFIHSPGLLAKKGNINRHTAFVPNGVDYYAYANVVAEPPDIAPIPRPRIGYSGFLKKALDWPLLLCLSQQHPEWSFVFVGAQSPYTALQSFMRELSTRTNVYFLGSKTTQELATYPQHFDVCIMPYEMNDYAKYVYPLKLHEYLASGRPVVGTRMRTLEDFAHVIALASSPKEWSIGITEALNSAVNTPECRMVRQQVAYQHDWRLIAERIAKIMACHLGEDYVNRLEKSLDSYGE